MTRWFARLPIHRKLVVMALVVTTTALVLATLGLIGLDLYRFRANATDDTQSLAQVMAENTAAAVTFDDPGAATETLATVRVRPSVQRACLYLANGPLFAGWERTTDLACPSVQPVPGTRRTVAGTASVSSNGRVIGTIYIERDLGEIGARISIAGLTGVVLLLLAVPITLVLSSRLSRTVSAPIAQLASTARGLRPEDKSVGLPTLNAGEDEVGDLVRAFTEMFTRVQVANTRLLETNETLQRQEAERERLLIREREASRLKDEFLAAVSHELRTPLNAIVGWIQILSTTRASEQTTAKAIASIARNAKAQTRVIDDLIDVSRIVTGKLNIRFDPVELREVVESAIEAIRPTAQAKTITLRIDVPREVCFVSGDRDRLQQIFWNLLSNAMKFTPQNGEVTTTLRIDRRTFVLEVADSGVGISPSFLPHVFDRFRQADGSITREQGGLGLGLAIVKELTELHGGVVTAASPGLSQGATFTVEFPKLPGLHTPAAFPTLRAPGATTLLGLRVLAVDDNEDALDVLASQLINSGAHVRVAMNAEQALEEWDREPPDVLICDLAMPVADGFDVIQAVRQRDKVSGHTTRAIALTAHAAPEYRIRARAEGFDGHLLKPFDGEELVKAVLEAGTQ